MVVDGIFEGVRARVTVANRVRTGSAEPQPRRALVNKEGQVLAQHDVCASVGNLPATCQTCGGCPGGCSPACNQASRLLMQGMWGDDSPPCKMHILITCM